MTDIEKLFTQADNTFTIFVVEQRFVVGRGHEYFHSYINTSNLIDSDEQIKERFSKAIETISKNVAPVEKLIKLFTAGFTHLNIAEIITSLCKLYTVHEHQLVGPNIIDPIILQEGKITKKALSHLVSLNKDSILRPTIIILLKDNNFERVKGLLSECPNGINIKMIWNSGKEEIYKVVNCGAQDVTSFMNLFSIQCYSTCSHTKKELLLNHEWAEDSIIKKYSPMLLKFRTNLLLDQKDDIRPELTELITKINSISNVNDKDEKIIRTFECISKLFRVFCNDRGGQDILDAYKIAKDLNHEILLAHIYRYAEFLPNCSTQEKIELYDIGYQIFQKYSMEDHAIYCKNNKLVEQFYTDYVRTDEFKDMQVEAINNVPGMVGLSHIYNNVGVAYLYNAQVDNAIEYFDKGLEYARNQDRIVQNLALESNKMIAESYSYCNVGENRIRFLMHRIFDGLGLKRLPFLAADYALNVLAVAYRQNVTFAEELINTFPLDILMQKSYDTSNINAGERLLQMQYLDIHYGIHFPLLSKCRIPTNLNSTGGKRKDFILCHGLNPFDFETWL